MMSMIRKPANQHYIYLFIKHWSQWINFHWNFFIHRISLSNYFEQLVNTVTMYIFHLKKLDFMLAYHQNGHSISAKQGTECKTWLRQWAGKKEPIDSSWKTIDCCLTLKDGWKDCVFFYLIWRCSRSGICFGISSSNGTQYVFCAQQYISEEYLEVYFVNFFINFNLHILPNRVGTKHLPNIPVVFLKKFSFWNRSFFDKSCKFFANFDHKF